MSGQLEWIGAGCEGGNTTGGCVGGGGASDDERAAYGYSGAPLFNRP